MPTSETASLVVWDGPGWYGYHTSSQGDRIYGKCGDDYLKMPDQERLRKLSMAWYDEPPVWASYVRSARK